MSRHNSAMNDESCPTEFATNSMGPRLFVPGPLLVGAKVELPAAAAQHVGRALRLREGDAVTLFDGTGGECAARLTELRKNAVDAEVLSFLPVERESGFPIRLVQCLQSGDKMDYTLQKAVELGVAEMIPVISRRSVVRLAGDRASKRVEHWRQIVISASEQCGRNRLASVGDIVTLEQWLMQPAKDGFRRVLLSPHAEDTVSTLFGEERPAGLEILIGPEGGLAPDEVEVALLKNFCKLRLGPRVLRTETAGLAAIAAVHARWGDFN